MIVEFQKFSLRNIVTGRRDEKQKDKKEPLNTGFKVRRGRDSGWGWLRLMSHEWVASRRRSIGR
jgi:hypothetical protein